MEQANQTVLNMLGKLEAEDKEEWVQHLPTLLYAYNVTRSSITGYSLYFLMYRQQPRLPTDFPCLIMNVGPVSRRTYVKKLKVCLNEAFHLADQLNSKEMNW